jgi:hypothetical protein
MLLPLLLLSFKCKTLRNRPFSTSAKLASVETSDAELAVAMYQEEVKLKEQLIRDRALASRLQPPETNTWAIPRRAPQTSVVAPLAVRIPVRMPSPDPLPAYEQLSNVPETMNSAPLGISENAASSKAKNIESECTIAVTLFPEKLLWVP